MGAKLGTVSGEVVDLQSFSAADVKLWDIAWALSNQNRYLGHTLVPWSVLSHTGLCYQLYMRDCGLEGKQPDDATAAAILLHDAPEAYIGDMLGTLKRQDDYKHFRDLDDRIFKVILERFNVCEGNVDLELITRYDKQALWVEYNKLHPASAKVGAEIPKQYEMPLSGQLSLAKPTDYVDLLKGMAIRLGAHDVAALCEFPEHLKPYLEQTKEQLPQFDAPQSVRGVEDMSL